MVTRELRRGSARGLKNKPIKRRFTRVYTKAGPPDPAALHHANAGPAGRNKNKTRDDDDDEDDGDDEVQLDVAGLERIE